MGEEKEKPSLFARRVQQQLAQSLQAKISHYSCEDFFLQFSAMKSHLPPETGLVTYNAMKEIFSVNVDTIRKHMRSFARMNSSGSGFLNFEEFKHGFQALLHEPSKEQTEFLAYLFDQLTDGSGSLSFRRFLVGLVLVNEKSETDEDVNVSTSPTAPPVVKLEAVRRDLYTKLTFASFASKYEDRFTWEEFQKVWNELTPQLSGAHESFQAMSEGTEEVTWEKFNKYANDNPSFVNDMRKNFFNTLSNVT